MKKAILLSLVALMTLLLCVSRKSDKNEPEPVPNPSQEKGVTRKIVVDVFDYTKRVHINFDKGKMISASTPEAGLSWDPGLRHYDLKTDGDTSGKGKGAAAYTFRKSLMADIPTPRDSEWALDREGTPLVRPDVNEHEMEYEEQSANSLLTSELKDDGKGYLNKGIINRAGMSPTVTVDSSVFPVHSAIDQIICVRILDYRSATRETGYIALEYIIRADKE